jgi:hypothetical protein
MPAIAQNADIGLRDSGGKSLAALQDLGATTSDEIARNKSRQTRRAAKGHASRPAVDSRSLPPLTSYPGADRIGLRGGVGPMDSGLAPAPTIAANPTIAAKHRPPADDRPFDPTGFALGSLRLKPYFEEDFGYASNPLSLPAGAKGSSYENSEVGLAFQSDWARNDLHGALRGGYTDYFADSAANAPYGNGLVAGRYDISKDFAIDAETHFDVLTQTPGSLFLPPGAVLSTFHRPLIETFGGAFGGKKKLGDLALSLHGTFDRILYGNSTLTGGTIGNLSSDDSSDWGLRGRAAYQISPIIAPFLEIDADKRNYDSIVDSGGYQRNSKGLSALGGTTIALTGQLTGEASAGYGSRTYQDPRLPNLSGPLFDASLVWGVTPLTTVTLKAATTLADTTTPGASGAISRAYTIGISHELLRNLTLTANAGYATDVYSGVTIHDETTTFGLGAEYKLSREAVLKLSATRTKFSSSLPDANYSANVFMLGLRVQR